MKKLSFTASLLISLALIAGCGNADISPANNTNAAAPAKKTAQPKDYKVGDTVNFNGLRITVNGYRTTKGSDIEKPQNGQFLLVNLTIENTTKQTANISTVMNMSLQAADGTKYDATLYTGVKGQLDGQVAPGRKVKGEVPFDVAPAKSYEFIFEDPFQNGQAIWKLS